MEWFCKGEHGIWAGCGGKQEMEELRPCPFCGAQAELWVTYTIQDKDNATAAALQEQISYSRMYKAVCPACRCSTELMHDRYRAIAFWNRRN